MTDIHTHILPGIDDGSQNVEMSIALLEQEVAEGVNQIVFTPHFEPSHQNIDAFLQMRQKAVDQLENILAEKFPTITWKLGAEVLYATNLIQMPLEEVQKLAIEGTPYVLVEFSTKKPPMMVENLFEKWQSYEIIPIIAHVERYPYVCENPKILEEWIHMGAVIQSNASSIIKKGERAKFIKKAVDKKMIHVIASDAHEPSMRPANVAKGISSLNSFFSPKRAEPLIQNAEVIFNGENILKAMNEQI